MTPLVYPHNDKPEFAADGRRYVYQDGGQRFRSLNSFTWTCPHCGFGPTGLEGAHEHLNAVHYTKESNARNDHPPVR